MTTPSPDCRPAVPNTSARVVIGLVAVAVLSAAMLDYLQSRRGGPAHIFSVRSPAVQEEKEETTPVPLSVEIREGLAATGFPAESPNPLPPEVESAQTAVIVPAEVYKTAAPAFETEMAARGIVIEARDDVRTDDFTGVRWHIRRGAYEVSRILFLWPGEKPAVAPPAALKTTKPPAGPGRVALVVDDMGNDLKALEILIGLGQRLTVAILPYSDHAVKTAEIARVNGIEVMLHLPLESLNSHESEATTRGLIRSDMSRTAIRRMMEDNLARVPHIRGVNNHMGSKGTADSSLMRLVLEPLKDRSLFFLDSLTSGRSIAAATAREMGIPAATRSVFLDDGGDPMSVGERLDELFRQARAEGFAVGICHPYPQTLEVLRMRFRGLDTLGLEAVHVSEIVRR